MDYAIIITLGPGSRSTQQWEEMLRAGATAFRLNTSHLQIDQVNQWIEKIGDFRRKTGGGFSLILDLQASKWRLGQLQPIELEVGTKVELVYAEQTLQPGALPVPHMDFFKAAPTSKGKITINDAKIILQIEQVDGEIVKTCVIQGGQALSNKGISLLGTNFRIEGLNPKDRIIYEETVGKTWIRYAVSYVRDSSEMGSYGALLGGAHRLIAKLERRPAIEDVVGIAQNAGELWVCRGDLGAEIGLRGMAEAVADVTKQIGAIRKPVMMAGQVLEHMTDHSQPTRSEVCYLHDCLVQGYAGFVLSDETAIGKFPVDASRAAALFC